MGRSRWGDLVLAWLWPNSLKPRDRFLRLLFFVLFLIVSIQCVSRFGRADLDYKVFHGAGEKILLSSSSIYPLPPSDGWGIFTFKYSPTFAILFSPFSLFSLSQSQWIWAVLNSILFLLSWLLMERIFASYRSTVGDQSLPLSWGLRCLTLIVIVDPLTLNAVQGNMNVLVLFLMLAVLFCFSPIQDSSVDLPQKSLSSFTLTEVLGSALLALAISIKLTPGILVFKLVLERRWRLLFFTLSAAVFLLLVPPALLFGWARTFDLFHEWRAVLGDVNHFPFFGIINQSPQSVVARWGMNPLWSWVSVVACVALGVSAYLKSRRCLVGDFILMALILVVSPVAWIEYQVLLLPLYFWIHRFVLNSQLSRPVLVLFWMRFFLVHLGTRVFLGKETANLLLFYGSHLIGILVLFIIAAMTSRGQRSVDLTSRSLTRF